MPIEGCVFDEGVRYLYEQIWEFEHLPFFSLYGALYVQGVSSRLSTPVKTSLQHRHKSLYIWPKRRLHFHCGATVTLTRWKFLARIMPHMYKWFPPSWKEIESRTVEHRVIKVAVGMLFRTLLTDLRWSHGWCCGERKIEKIQFFWTIRSAWGLVEVEALVTAHTALYYD